MLSLKDILGGGADLPADLAPLDSEGDTRGSNAINLQTGRSAPENVASGNNAVAVGYDSKATTASLAVGYQAIGNIQSVGIGENAAAHYAGTAIGRNAYAKQTSVGVGHDAYSKYGGTAVGYKAKGQQNGIGIGYEADADSGGIAHGYKSYARTNSVGIGGYARGYGSQGVAVGYKAKGYGIGGVALGREAVANGGLAIGSYAYAQDYNLAIGYKAKVSSAYSAVIAGGICTRKTVNTANVHKLYDFAAAEITIMTDVIDLTAVGDTEISLPSGVHFYPNEVGVIVTAADTVSGQPELSFGEGTESLDTLSAAAAATGLDSLHARERRTSLSQESGVTALSASVTSAGSATSLSGRFYFQGLLVEDE